MAGADRVIAGTDCGFGAVDPEIAWAKLRALVEAVRFAPGQDVALLNAILHVIVEEGLHDAAFVASRVEGFAELRAHLAGHTPEAMERLCGVKAA